MAIPTNGTYDGVTLYAVTPLTSEPGAADALAAFEAQVGDLDPDIAAQLASLVIVSGTVAADTSVTFAGSSLTVGGMTLDDSDVVAQGSSAFEFTAGGSSYLLSNDVIPTVTVDQLLDDAILAAGSDPSTSAIVLPLIELKGALDRAGLGGDAILSNTLVGGLPYAPPCFARCTRIATTRGDVPVEALVAGDLVVLARGGTAPVTWVGRRRIDLRLHPDPASVQPIRVRAGALGDGVPHRDLRVSPDHALLLDGVLVPAGLLVDGRGIVRERSDRVEYFHIELPTHEALLAEGAAAESYLDTGNRAAFANARLVALMPDLARHSASPSVATTPCATLVLDGERLDAIRARLAGVADEAAAGMQQAG